MMSAEWSGIMTDMEPAVQQAAADTQQQFLRRIHAATPRTWVTPALLAINVGVFAVMAAYGINLLGGRPEEYLRFGANFAPLTTGGEWWRLLTCTFLHFGIVHLAFNMWALWDTGRLTERLFGNCGFAALYLYAGIAGSNASLLWNQQVIGVGASGAVFGVFGALLAYMTVQRGSIPAEIINRLRVSTSVFVVYSLFYGFMQSGIDNAAHLGGLLGGFAAGLILARPLDPLPRHRGNAVRAVLAALLAAATLPTAAWLIPDTSRIYRQAITLQKEIEIFSARENELLAAFGAIVEQSHQGRLGDVDALRELRTRVLPEWNQAVTRLAGVELDANAPTRTDYELLMRYANAKRDTIKAMADYMETGNPAYERAVRELQSQAGDALALYRKRQQK